MYANQSKRSLPNGGVREMEVLDNPLLNGWQCGLNTNDGIKIAVQLWSFRNVSFYNFKRKGHYGSNCN